MILGLTESIVSLGFSWQKNNYFFSFQICGRIICFMFFAYFWGIGQLYPLIAGILIHIFVLLIAKVIGNSYFKHQLNPDKKTKEKSDADQEGHFFSFLKKVYKYFINPTLNSFANIYVYSRLYDGNQRALCDESIKFTMQKFLGTEIFIIMENLAIFILHLVYFQINRDLQQNQCLEFRAMTKRNIFKS